MLQTEKKWADFDEEDDELYDARKWEDLGDDDLNKNQKLSHFTNYKDGIKVVTKYTENMKKQTFKVTKHIKEVIIKRKYNKEIEVRKEKIKQFNVNKSDSVTVEPGDIVNIEVPKISALDFLKDTEYDYLFADNKNKNTKDLKTRFMKLKNDDETKDEETKDIPRRSDGTYHRSDDTQHRECTVRVTNLREDVNETELSNLFGKVGAIVKMYLAKHKETQSSKGFAFITYSNREQAKNAIDKFNRHGFENLLLNVEWARPSNK